MSDLPTGWAKCRLDECSENLDNRRVPVNSSERAGRQGDVPYYGATGQVGWIDRPLFDEELVLLGEDGAPFLERDRPKAYLISGPSWVNNHAHVLRGLAASNRYLLHFLNSIDYHGLANGTTRLKLTQASMNSIVVRLAPQGEQERIVDAIEEQFSRLDAGAAALERVRRNLKRVRAAVLQAAVTGRLGNRTAEATGATDWLNSVYKERLLSKTSRNRKRAAPTNDITSPPFPVPHTWTWTTLGALAEKITDGEHLSPLKTIQGMPLLTAKHVTDRGLTLEDPQFVSLDDGDAFRRRCDPRPGDVLICSRGTVGRCAVVKTEEKFCLMGSVILTRLPSTAAPDFFRYFLSGTWAQNLMQGVSGGTTIRALYLRDIEKCPVPVPPPLEQHSIVSEVERVVSYIQALEDFMVELNVAILSLRSSILAAAFSGRLVPQDAGEEGASILLERIAADRASSMNGDETKATRKPRTKRTMAPA